MHIFKADLHVHTVLSPCAEVEMIPPLIVEEAISKSIDIIAITDHNSISNIESVQKAAKHTEIKIIPGIEIQTKEEIHSLCLFNSLSNCKKFFSEIETFFPTKKNKPEIFGEQFIVDHTGKFIARENQLLISSVNISLEKAFDLTKKYNGLFIPAHIDNKTFGMIGHLGIIPGSIKFDALEISKNLHIDDTELIFKNPLAIPIIKNSDSHQLSDLYGYNHFYLNTPSLHEISLALYNRYDRSYKVNKRCL